MARRYNITELGSRLRAERKLAGMSVLDLAHKTGYESRSIQQWESGHCAPRVDSLVVLCQALECSADYLLGREA